MNIDYYARSIDERELIEGLFNSDNNVHKFLVSEVVNLSKVNGLTKLDDIKNVVYEDPNNGFAHFVNLLEKNKIIRITDADFSNPNEHLGQIKLYFEAEIVSRDNLKNVVDIFVDNSFSDKFGEPKQQSLTLNSLRKKFTRLENVDFYFSQSDIEVKVEGLTSDEAINHIHIIKILRELSNEGYINFTLLSIDLLNRDNWNGFSETNRHWYRGYGFFSKIHIYPQLIHKWSVENGIFDEKIKFDIDSGQLWLADANYAVVRGVKDKPSKIALFWDAIVSKVNTTTSYENLWMIVNDTKSCSLSKTNVQNELKDLRIQVKNKIEELGLIESLSIEADKGYRLNYIPSHFGLSPQK